MVGEREGEIKAQLTDSGVQRWEVGCIRKSELMEEKMASGYQNKSLEEVLGGGSVLGESSSASASEEEATASGELLSSSMIATESGGLDWVELKK